MAPIYWLYNEKSHKLWILVTFHVVWWINEDFTNFFCALVVGTTDKIILLRSAQVWPARRATEFYVISLLWWLISALWSTKTDTPMFLHWVWAPVHQRAHLNRHTVQILRKEIECILCFLDLLFQRTVTFRLLEIQHQTFNCFCRKWANETIFCQCNQTSLIFRVIFRFPSY